MRMARLAPREIQAGRNREDAGRPGLDPAAGGLGGGSGHGVFSLSPPSTSRAAYIVPGRQLGTGHREYAWFTSRRKAKVHTLGAMIHITGLGDRPGQSGQVWQGRRGHHFRPLVEPLPPREVLVTADAMHRTRDNACVLSVDLSSMLI